MCKKGIICLAAVVVMGIGSITSFASTEAFEAYDTTVARLNGSGYSGYQTKGRSSKDAELQSDVVGGNYTVDARLKASSGTGDWEQKVGDNDFRYLDNSVQKDSSCRVQFSNDLTTPVAVQVTGSWCSQ